MSQAYPEAALFQAFKLLTLVNHVQATIDKRTTLMIETMLLIDEATIALGRPITLAECRTVAQDSQDERQRAAKNGVTTRDFEQQLADAKAFLSGVKVPGNSRRAFGSQHADQ